jgi:hypothetical protein
MSKRLDRPIYLVSGEAQRAALLAKGETDPIYLGEEVPHLRGLAADDLQRLAEVKQLFGGTITATTPRGVTTP